MHFKHICHHAQIANARPPYHIHSGTSCDKHLCVCIKTQRTTNISDKITDFVVVKIGAGWLWDLQRDFLSSIYNMIEEKVHDE